MENRILRFVLLMLIAMTSSICVNAQNGVAKKINSVKLSGECFYAESTDPSEDVAKKDASTFLANYINEYLKDNGLSIAHVTENSIPGIKYFTMNRSGNKRVFAFVEKSVILDGAQPAPQPVLDPEPVNEPVKKSEPQLKPAPTSVAKTSDSGFNQGILDELEKSNTETVAKALAKLAESKNMKESFLAIQRLNAEYIVKYYGPITKCKNRMWSYWLIYSPDGTDLLGFLSPGKEGERINILDSSENASLDSFLGQGNNAIYFELR